MKNFTFERGPFSTCEKCAKNTFGNLSVGGNTLTKRCSNCRHTKRLPLPPLDKKVIYLDQFAFSLIHNVRTDGRLPKGHEEFAVQLHDQLRRLVLLQQIVLPHSDIHSDETTVWSKGNELRATYEFFGGDVRLVDSITIETNQILDAAVSFANNGPVLSEFSVDDALEDERNSWLSDMHISVESDFSAFADDIRNTRQELFQRVLELAALWSTMSFRQVLDRELNGSGGDKVRAFFNAQDARKSNDGTLILTGELTGIEIEVIELRRIMMEAGATEEKAIESILLFWNSEHFRSLPHHKISSYLFAATARRVAAGGKKIINEGMMNDVRAISSYAPYLDAMFIDKTSEAILEERELREGLSYRSKIFSFKTKNGFLEYLGGLEESTPSNVKELCKSIYGE